MTKSQLNIAAMLKKAGRKVTVINEPREGIRHGIDCPKAEHVDTGYEHDASADGPYFIDGVRYCGRCHYHF